MRFRLPGETLVPRARLRRSYRAPSRSPCSPFSVSAIRDPPARSRCRPLARDRRREACRVRAKVTLRGVGETVWYTRLRWRMRGAWLWPAFVGLTVIDGVLINRLPPYGWTPPGIVGALLLAGFANLLL